MPKSNILKNVIVISLIISFSSIATENHTPIIDAMKQWKIGNKWQIEFSQYSKPWALSSGSHERSKVSILDYKYYIIAEVVDSTIDMNVKCWVLKYYSKSKLPMDYHNTVGYLVYMSRCDGSVIKIINNTAKKEEIYWQYIFDDGFQKGSTVNDEFPIETIASIMPCTVIEDMWNGNPPPIKPSMARAPRPKASLKIENVNSIKKSYLLKFPNTYNDVPNLVLYQEWEKGASWWKTFKKYKYGYISFEAIRCDDPEQFKKLSDSSDAYRLNYIKTHPTRTR